MENPLIVLPAWTLDKDSYSKLIKYSPEGKEVFVTPMEEITPKGKIEGFDKNLLGLMNTKGFAKVDLLGHSLGGALALKFTSQHPDRVNRLFLVDSKGAAVSEDIGQALFAQVKDWLTHVDKKLGMGLGAPFRILQNPALHFKLGLYAKDVNLEEEASYLKIPTTIIWGERDCVVPLRQAERLHSLISNSRLIVLKNMDHNWLVHSPEKFWENIY